MTTFADIQKVLFDWYSTATGLETIWMNEAAPRAAKTYGALKLFGPVRLGLVDEVRYPAADKPSEHIVIAGMRRYFLNCQAYGSEAADSMIAAQNSLQKSEVRATLKRKQTTTISVITIQNLASYVVTVDGNPVEITSDADATAKEIRDALVSTVNSNIYIDPHIKAEDGATDDELIVSGRSGYEFAIAVDAKLNIDNQVNSVGLAYIRDDGISDIAELLETKWESRYSMDIQLFGNSVITETSPDLIEKVEISAKLGDVTIPTWEI